MKVRFILSFFSFLFPMLQSFAQYGETISSDRPGQSNSPNTVGKMVLQLQTGLQFDGAKDDNYKQNMFAWPALIRFGITDKIELQTLWGYQNAKAEVFNNEYTAKGINLSSFGLRFNIFEETDKAPALGFEFNYKTRMLSQDYKPDHPAAKVNMMASKTLNDQLSVTANLGTDFDGNGGSPDGFYTLNLALSVNEEISIFFENYGYFNKDYFDTYFDLGGGYLLNNNLQLDLYGGFGYNDGVFQYMVSGGVSYRITKWRKE